MQWALDFNIAPLVEQINYRNNILFVGSCFSEHMSERMKKRMFHVLENPNGILYDPVSISRSLTAYAENKQATEEQLHFHNDLWHSWQHHSVFSGTDKQEVLANINNAIEEAHTFLSSAEWIIITLGTSFYYRIAASGEPVANCHKVPGTFFKKQLLSTEIIIEQLKSAINSIRELNPSAKVLFTVSPIRHIKDGISENNHSKARLLDAVHTLRELLPHIYYFPAYEIVIDVLRDYRFYDKDLVHPNLIAIEHVFSQFIECALDKQSRMILSSVESYLKLMQHRSLSKSKAIQDVLVVQRARLLEQIREKYPFICFNNLPVTLS
jgi:hypothetical protein